MKKRFLTILLATLMVASLLPTVAFAAGTEISTITATSDTSGCFAGKTWGEVKDTIFTFEDGVTAYQIILVDPTNMSPADDSYVLVEGTEYMCSLDVKAPEGSYFKHIVAQTEPKMYNSETTMTIDGGVPGAGTVSFTAPEMTMDTAYVEDENPIYFRLTVPFMFTATEAPLGSTVTATVPLGEPTYTFHIPASTKLEFNNANKQALNGAVYIDGVKNMAIKEATCTVAGENLKKGSDTIETAYFYGENGATAVATTPTFNCGEGEANGTPIYAQVTANAWSNAKPGDYTATVTFTFDVTPVAIKDIFTCVATPVGLSLTGGWESSEMYGSNALPMLQAGLVDLSAMQMIPIDLAFVVVPNLKKSSQMMTDANLPVAPVDNGWMAVDTDLNNGGDYTYNFITDNSGKVVELRVSIDQSMLENYYLDTGDNINDYATLVAYPPAAE